MSPNLLAATQHRDGITEECTSKPVSYARLERIHRKMYVQPSHSLLRILVICACSWAVSTSVKGELFILHYSHVSFIRTTWFLMALAGIRNRVD